MKIVICGPRGFGDYGLLVSKMDALLKRVLKEESVTIISGTAGGADSLGARYARERGLKLVEMPAQWMLYGRVAGFRRNSDMIAIADAVVAFWDGFSRGTQDTITKAREKGIPVRIIRYSGARTEYESVPAPVAPEGAVWCQWCGERIAAKGIPCDQCRALGARA